MSAPEWFETKSVLPPDGTEVEATDSGGHVHRLFFQSNLWFTEDHSMYIYFVPVCWRYR